VVRVTVPENSTEEIYQYEGPKGKNFCSREHIIVKYVPKNVPENSLRLSMQPLLPPYPDKTVFYSPQPLTHFLKLGLKLSLAWHGHDIRYNSLAPLWQTVIMICLDTFGPAISLPWISACMIIIIE